MIDISAEKVFSPAELVNHIPRRRAGKKCNIATVYRWMQVGVRGVQLEYICIGGTRCTSMEALQRFYDSITAKSNGLPAQVSPRLTATRRKQIEAAERRLAKAGI